MLLDVLNLWKKVIKFIHETFNLTKDTLLVKKVAEICKKYNPKIFT